MDVDGGITDDGLVSDNSCVGVAVAVLERHPHGILLDDWLYPSTQSYSNRFPLSRKAMRLVVDLIPPRVGPAGFR